MSLLFGSHLSGADVTDFGAVGDGVTDNTTAIRKALAASTMVHFPAGVYRVTDGIKLPPSAILTGAGSPTLGTFPLKDDDKRYLREGHVQTLPGTTLLFTGEGQARSPSGRDDQFADMTYAIKTATGLPWQIRDLAIVMDMQVLNEKGRPTSPEDDARASYDVGLLVDDSPGGTLRDCSIFGYWEKAGLCVLSRGESSNPDYNTFWNSSFSGEYGVAILGSNSGEGPGLSGTQFYGCNLFSADHHLRKAGQWGSGALYIDGDTASQRAEINGHYFFGGCVRTYHNVAVRLDHASNVTFHGVIFEVPGFDGEANAGADTTGKVVGTENTHNVLFSGCRMHDIGLRELARNMVDGTVTISGAHGVSVQSGANLVRLHALANGDPMLQLTNNGQSINDGWTIRQDVSEDDALVLRHNNKPMLSLTTDGAMKTRHAGVNTLSLGRSSLQRIQDGSVRAERSRIRLREDEQADLVRIEGGNEGQILTLELDAASAAVVIRADSTGNLKLGHDCRLTSETDRLLLMKSGENWVELSRAAP